MKKLSILILLVTMGSIAMAQSTLSLKLDASGEDATIDDFNPSQNNPAEIEYFSGSWTIVGTSVIWRNLFKFDFNQIPANAVIQSAYLNLYFAPLNNFGANDTSLTNSNESVLQRVTGAWSETTVTWLNQPSTTLQNQVILPASVSSTQDYLLTDVTALVQDMYNSASNDGFMLKLQNETPYARLIFASGDYPDPALHPELIINYTLCNTVVMDENGEDATIDDYNPGNNNPNEIELTSNAWTILGAGVTWRSFMKFDLSQIPSNATITNAQLSLFYADTNTFGNAQHSSLTNSNESLIMRVLDPWSENQITWNNQPQVTSQNQVVLTQSVTGIDDYPNIDVTAQVQDMMIAPNGNQGFLLRLTNEVYYAQMIFASGDNPHFNKRPVLEVCYTVPTAIQETAATDEGFTVFPNPSNGEFTVMAGAITKIEVYDAIGKSVYAKTVSAFNTWALKIDLNHPTPGIYFIRVQSGKKWLTQKIVIY